MYNPQVQPPMLTLFPSSTSRSSSRTNSLSLNATAPPIAPKPGSAPEDPIFGAIDDDLRDARRVGTHGEEEDLRSALEKVIGRVEELVSFRKTKQFNLQN